VNGPIVPIPAYGRGSLAELTPSLFAALGTPGFENTLHVEPLQAACLLVIDGLGWELLRGHPEDAPFLHGLAAHGLTTGFPATTTSSLGSIGTGLPPGEHGLVGYCFAVPGYDRPMNALKWQLYGSGPQVDLREAFAPELAQPRPTVFERAAAAGVRVTLIGPGYLARSPLERAVLRGGRYRFALGMGDLASEATRAFGEGRSFAYAYHPALDTTGHVRGLASEAWALELRHVDRVAEDIADRLRPGQVLVVTGDHGMVDLDRADRVEVADHPELMNGVRMLGGEARARHVYTRDGAAEEVRDAWQALLGNRMWVRTRDEAIEEGWFGPVVQGEIRPRIGDVVAAAFGPVGVFQKEVDSRQAEFVGHHGSMTNDEQIVPFILVRG
jgi:Type I phosphodiesterase / nucleotide pyrophosphatase